MPNLFLEFLQILFYNQVLRPFVKPAVDTTLQKFAENAVSTLKKTKEVSRKCGTAKDKFRRAIIISGSPGPLAKHDVRQMQCNIKLCVWHDIFDIYLRYLIYI